MQEHPSEAELAELASSVALAVLEPPVDPSEPSSACYATTTQESVSTCPELPSHPLEGLD